MAKRLVITEKPSVARDIAAALGGFVEGDECLESEDFVVTWAVGHLLELAEPDDYDKVWRSWEIKHLPIIPEQFQLRPRDGQKKRLDKITKLGHRKDVVGIVNACDAGREGELIYRRIVDYCELGDKPQERLWLQSMTKQAIKDAFAALRPGKDLDPLADAAWLRSVGDWLVGMNATRALTQRLKSRGEREAWSAGRVQTPTLKILVAREREILAHVPVPYWEILAQFEHAATGQTWDARFYDAKAGADEEDEEAIRKPTRIFDRAEVDRIVAAIEGAKTGLASEKRKKSRQNPPLLFDLTSLQREASRRYSMSAKRTLNAAQSLYEGHKVLTYPRTDSRHLPEDYGPVVDQLLTSVAGLTGDWAPLAAIASGITAAGPQNMPRILDSSKVRDHFAIIPTGNPVPPLSGDDLRVFDLVLRQFLAALMGPATFATVERWVDIPTDGKKGPARFRATARMLEIPGYLEALGQHAGTGTSLPPLAPGQDEADGVSVARGPYQVEDKVTKPPPRYNEGQLLRMMETAGERIPESAPGEVGADDLSDAMKERGLGTPATRADTIERLVSTTYARRVGGKLVPTSKAMRMMDVLERVNADGLASPRLTGEWEFRLNQVADGKLPRAEVLKGLVDYTRKVTNAVKGFEYDEIYAGEAPLGTCPNCGGKVIESVWGYHCENNVPEDRTCNFIVWKDRFGRFIDRTLAERLLREHTVGPIDGFMDRSGRELIQGTITLKKDEEKGAWVLDTKFGRPTGEDGEPEVEQLIGPSWPCPAHEGCEILETTHRWVCKKVFEGTEKKGPQLPKKVCQRDLESDEVAGYFGGDLRTGLIEGFISRFGKPFKGMLVRKDSGKHEFDFPPRPDRPERPAKGKKKGADGETGKEGEAEAEAKPTKKKAPAKAAAKAAPKSGAKKPKAPPKAKKPPPPPGKKAAAAEPEEKPKPAVRRRKAADKPSVAPT